MPPRKLNEVAEKLLREVLPAGGHADGDRMHISNRLALREKAKQIRNDLPSVANDERRVSKFVNEARPSLVIGWVRPRIPAIPIGSRIAPKLQRVPSQSRSIDNMITPITTMAMPSACRGRGTSLSRNAATRTANSGVKLLSAPQMLGPMRRFASNVSKVTVAGNNKPTRTKIKAPRGSHPFQSSMNGARAEKSTAEVGMLTDAPRLGGTWRRPNWVSTSARPNRNEAHSASTCGSSSKSQPLMSGAEIEAKGYAIRQGQRTG